MVIVHVLLLLIDGADRAQTFRLARGQIFSKGQFSIDGIQVTPEVSQLLPNGFAGHFRGVFTASCVFQVIFPGAFTVRSRLLSVRGIVKNIQKRFGVLPGHVEQGNILRITDIGRRTGGVHDHSAAVSASSRLAVRIIIVILESGFFDLTLLCVPHDHLIDLTQYFRRQALAEIHHQRRVKGQLFVIIARIPAEILKIWVLLDLKRGFLVRIAILRLNDAGSQGQTQWLGHIAFPVCE